MFAYFYLLFAGAINAITYSTDPLPAGLAAPFQIISMTILARYTFLASSPRRALTYGLCFGISSFSVGLYWLYISMHSYGELPFFLAGLCVLLFATYLSLYYALSCYITRFLTPEPTLITPFVFAAAWVLGELLRAGLFTGFPWNNIAYAYLDSNLAYFAPVLGSYGVSFFAALCIGFCALTLVAVLARSWGNGIFSVCVGIFIVSFGGMLKDVHWVHPYGQPIEIRLVQTNVPINLKFDPLSQFSNMLDILNLATRAPDSNFPRVIIFPETSIPVMANEVPLTYWKQLLDISRLHNTTFLLGIPLSMERDDRFGISNSLIELNHRTQLSQIQKNGIQRYDKQHLVPFGEYIPWGFKWFVRMMHIPLGNLTAGIPPQTPFFIDHQYLAGNICYEDLFATEMIAPIKHKDATILFNISNLAWFGDSIALGQHLNITRMRALEMGRPVLSASNNGITAYINPEGKVISSLHSSVRHILDVNVQGYKGFTPFVHYANLPVIIMVVIFLMVGVFSKEYLLRQDAKAAKKKK